MIIIYNKIMLFLSAVRPYCCWKRNPLVYIDFNRLSAFLIGCMS